MRVSGILSGTVAALIAAATPACAGGGFYFGGGLGIESPANSTWRVPALNQVGQYDLEQSNTFLFDAGYKMPSGVRLELQGQYGQFDLHNFSLPGIASVLRGHISQATIYLNTNYDFAVFGGWGGTVGAGLGTNWNDAHGSSQAGLSILTGSDRAFAWQVMFGVTREIASNIDLSIDYRYQGLGSTKVTQTGVGDFHFGGIKSQTVSATARVYLSPF